jgi:outer membrane autotransporter protein
VFNGLESFVNAATGRIDMRDGAVGDTLNVFGAYSGTAGSRLLLDANNQTRLADVLITGAATGSTTLDVTLLAPPVFDLVGTLVVDASTGTSSTAFALGTVSQSNPYVRIGLLFDAPNNNFLLVGLPDQPVFESVMTGEALINFWYNSADAVTAQLDTARDGGTPNGGNSYLAGGGRFGGWVQLRTGNIERDASQSFTSGGTTSVFDVSYNQDFEGVQAGLDYQSGGTIIGITFGAERSNVEFDASLNGLDMDGMNVGAYVAFQSGGFFFNALGKVDWVNVDADPAPGLGASFDATAWGVRGVAGYRFNAGHAFVEPAVSLSWVNVDIDQYVSGAATVTFDDIHSFRGSAGIRVGGDLPVGAHTTFSPYVGVAAIDEFEGNVQNNFTLGNSIFLDQAAPGTFGELSAGATLRSGNFEAFVRGEYDFVGDRDGIQGRAGVRIRF